MTLLLVDSNCDPLVHLHNNNIMGYMLCQTAQSEINIYFMKLLIYVYKHINMLWFNNCYHESILLYCYETDNIHVYVCVRFCVCARAHTHVHIHINNQT